MSSNQVRKDLLTASGQDHYRSNVYQSSRIMFTAVVRDNNDFSNQNRIRAEIIERDSQTGKIIPGKDKDIPLNSLPLCIPLYSELCHVRPKIGELVVVFLENPSDVSSTRYWMGPILTSQKKLEFQAFDDSYSIFNASTFDNNNQGQKQDDNSGQIFAQPLDIALQGRLDADIILKNRESIIRAGSFLKNTLKPNLANPGFIQIKQFDDNSSQNNFSSISNSTFIPFSQINIQGTNINLIGNRGKFRDGSIVDDETDTNTELKNFGDVALTLHPAVFGDELIILLKLILNYLINHIHTPQSPPLTNDIQVQLLQYLNGPKLQNLISYNIRIN